MNGTENVSELPCVGPKTTSQNSTAIPLQETDFLSHSRRSKRLQKEDLPATKKGDVLPVSLPVNKELSNGNTENSSTTQIANASEKSCCSKNFQCESNEYLFGLYDPEFENSHSSNHKFYGCKRKGFPSPCSESFGLPDDPIFSNSPLFLDRTRKSPLDIDLADPWDICVLDLEYVDQPWLVEYPEVITPYWDVESLFPFEVEDIRQKIEPEYDLSKQRSLSDSFNISSGVFDASADNENESDSVFTSTPVKNQNSSLSLVSTINITNGEDNNVNIAVLKDEVLKALEEAIKKKSTIGNIDMKIQIVTSDLKSPSPKKSSVEVRINENVETESCRSSSSSKENYFIENARQKLKHISDTKELSKVTLSNLNEDWQDSPGSDANDKSQDELDSVNQCTESSSVKKTKKPSKTRKSNPGVRRSLRSCESNISTTSDNEASTSNSAQLSLEDSSLKHTPSSTTNKACKKKTPENLLKNNIFFSSETVSQQLLDVDTGNKEESQSDSKRILRSNNQFSQEDVSQSGSMVNKKQKSKGAFQDKDDSSTFVGKQKQKERLTHEELQFSQMKDVFKVINITKQRSRFTNEDSHSSQDESDSNEVLGRNRLRVRRTVPNMELQSKEDKGNVDKTSLEKQKGSERLLNIYSETSHNAIDNNRTVGDQNQGSEVHASQDESNTGKGTSKKSKSWVNLQSSQDDTSMVTNLKLKKNKILINEETLSSQDESDAGKKKVEVPKRKRRGRPRNHDSQLSQNESDISQTLGDPNKDRVQLSQSESSINKSRKLRGREICFKEDLPSSQDESDVSKDNLDRRRKTRVSKAKVQEKLDVSFNSYDECFTQITNKSVQTPLYSAKNQFDEDISPIKRILRSSTQHLRPAANELKEGRRRTLSSSASEKVSKQQNIFPARKRSVSANFDDKTAYSAPIRRSLRSQAAEPTKISVDVKSPEYMTNKNNTKPIQSFKSPKISFNLTNSFKESPRKFDTDSPIKSILKNVYDSAGRLIGVKVHREKHVKMPSTFEIKPEDEDVDKAPSKELKHQFVAPTEVELNSVKKEEEECLKENGITSRIKIVISPLEIKEEIKNEVGTMCPVLPLAGPESDVPPLRKSGRKSNIIQESVADNKSESFVKVKKNIGQIGETDYGLGNFVWAQVGKYPFWPAIVCQDPITQTFQKEEIKQNMLPRIYYHIRFFGDHGRRAWVFRKHIMLYCSSQDLEQIASKLKSETKSYTVIKPYLVTGSSQIIEKWHKAVEELNSLKNKKYDNIIKHMLESYANHLNNRKKRKLNNMLDASSESESEEPDPGGNKRRKKFRASEHPHVTADAQPIDNSLQNTRFDGFDEINITVGVQSTARGEQAARESSENVQNLELAKEQTSCKLSEQVQPTRDAENVSELAQNTEISEKITPRRSRRSLKAIESPLVMAESLDKNPDGAQQATSSEVADNWETSNETSARLVERRSLRASKSSSSNEISSGQSVGDEKLLSRLGKKQPDERSEAESKSSSDGRSSDSNMYSFEYQMELHKKNNLFNGLRNARVCDYCLKQGDLYKCKGKCGGFFHLECASKVTHPRVEKRARKREKSPSKAKIRSAAPSVDSTPKSNRIEEGCRTRNQCQVQIITIKSKHAIGTPKKVNLPANFDELSLSEQIDYGMKEMMSKFENRTVYVDSTDSSSEEGSIIASKNKQLGFLDSPASSVAIESEKSAAKSSDLDENGEEEKSSDDLEVSTLSDNAQKSSEGIKHVTADSVILTESETPMDITNLKCTYCRLELDPPCFACGLEISRRGSSTRRKCSQFRCGRYYHPYCLKMWPQAQWSIGKWSRNQEQEDSFTCPAHTCHTCFSEELGSAACRLPGDKLVRCMMCPAGFHTTTFCIPAGTEVLGGSQIVCPRHRPKPTQPINTIWCFICSEGGNLICCDTCPTSVHPECQPINLTDDDKYICEDCESGRFPLYDEIVWVKLGQYRWWPAIVLFPNEIPENVKALKHQRGDFAVRFFGTNDHYWVNKARSFLFQEGDRGGSPGEANKSKNKVYETFGKAIEDAALAYKRKKEFKLRREAESINSLKPPTYVRINKNKPVGNVKSLELDLSNATACECDPNKPHPCGPEGNCINRLLMTECDPDVCPASSRCRNQSFQKRDYPPMIPYKTQGRGWGLKCLAPIKKGQFVIEYVGELIDSEEYQRRIQKMHEQKEENYYFMTVDSDRMIDAGPKGNLSRFMNHCCNPNCVTQKWTVRGDTRVGLFAKCDIESGSELTFNYNLEVVGQEKKVCKCGAGNCSGFIGVKAKADKLEKPLTDPVTEPTEQRRPRKYNKKRAVSPPLIPPCFTCGRKQSDLTCNNKFCNKGYHLNCLKLEEMPEVTKFTCPRHNCNICSNRTIRCCVKCTNSFCPSHSEGNVRHDKFLGFVCRLHDPDISRTKKKPTNKSIYSYPPEKREAIRAGWRFYKRKEYEKKRLIKINMNENRIRGRKTPTSELKQKASANYGKNTKKTTRPENSKILISNPFTKYHRQIKTGGILKVPKKDRELMRATWRKYKSVSRIKQKEKSEREGRCEAQSMVIQVNDVTKVEEKGLRTIDYNEMTDVQSSDMTNIQRQVESGKGPIDVENAKEKVSVTAVKSAPAIVQLNGVVVAEEEGGSLQNNIVTSENQDDSNEISDVVQWERSEFEPIKSIKRRRQKPELTDESAVSSTTSDEDSTRAPTLQKPSRKETPNAEDNELERTDPVSSTPPKEPAAPSEPKESQGKNDPNSSEDELTLDKRRIKRRSGVRNPRKKIRVNVKNLVSTAKTS